MWTLKEFKNLKASYKNLSKELLEHPDFKKIETIFEQIENLNLTDEIDCIQSELIDSFQQYIVEMINSSSPPLACIALYWAGAEIAPWVPTTVVADGFSDFSYNQTEDHAEFKPRGRIFHFKSAFELGEIGEILTQVAENEDLKRSPVRDLLEKILILKSLDCASEAIEIASRSEAFKKLSKREKDFCFFAKPGHDEPTIVLWP